MEYSLKHDDLERFEFTKYVKSDSLAYDIEFINREQIKNIEINSARGFELDNLEILKEISFIERLNIVVDPSVDISAIHYLMKLKHLRFAYDYKTTIDLSSFPELESLGCHWSYRILNLDKCSTLKKLLLFKFKKELPYLQSLKSLQYLDLRQGTITSLEGIENFKDINTVHLYGLTKLEDIAPLTKAKQSLKYLIIDTCKKIKEVSTVMPQLENIEILGLSNIGELSDIEFIRDMKSLKDFRFVDTNVLNGDLSPVISLEYAGFMNKRHYSHTFEEMKMLNQRSGKSV